MEASDGKFYVVKFRNNPQHRRVLVNEWIASVFLKQLQIATPDAALIEITPEFLDSEPDVYMQSGSRRLAVKPGWHFGSQFPGDPQRVPVFDFLPDSLLSQCVNLRDYVGALVFDKWVSNADGRQSIFYKARIRDGRGDEVLEKGFVTQMMDNGFIFDGPNWQYGDSPIQGHYFRAQVYTAVRKLDDFLRLNEREIPDHAGRISARLGEEIAHEEFGKYGESQKQVERVEDLNALESSIGVVEGNRKKPRGGADGQPVIPCCKSERETMCLTPNSSPTFGSDWPLPC